MDDVKAVLVANKTKVPKQGRIYTVEKEDDLPTGQLNPGDLCFVEETQRLYIAVSGALWRNIVVGSV